MLTKYEIEKLKYSLGVPNIHQKHLVSLVTIKNYLSEKMTHRNLISEQKSLIAESTLNMIAANGCMSPAVKAALDNEFGRYAEGNIGAREYKGNRFRDILDVKILMMAERVFHCPASKIDIRPVSGTNANAAVFSSLLHRGDKVISLNLCHGGHVSHSRFGLLGALGVEVFSWPFDATKMKIDVDQAIEMINLVKPELVIFGGSVFLFPSDVRKIIDGSDHKPLVMADYAHVLGLIAGDFFTDIQHEPLDIMTASTHKTFPGPQGGIICIYNKDLVDDVKDGVFPRVTCHDHGRRLPALLVAFQEMIEYGHEYAKNMVHNAKQLARRLRHLGIHVVAQNEDFTKSHQVLIHNSDADNAVCQLEENAIISNKNLGPLDTVSEYSMEYPSYIRFGVQEITRLGMMTKDMDTVAQLIVDSLYGKDVRDSVIEFRKQFNHMLYWSGDL